LAYVVSHTLVLDPTDDYQALIFLVICGPVWTDSVQDKIRYAADVHRWQIVSSGADTVVCVLSLSQL